MLEVVTGASLAALTDAATQHLSGSSASSVPLEYKVYPNKEDLPTDLHKASPEISHLYNSSLALKAEDVPFHAACKRRRPTWVDASR